MNKLGKIIVVVAMIAVNYITASYNQLVVGDLKNKSA